MQEKEHYKPKLEQPSIPEIEKREYSPESSAAPNDSKTSNENILKTGEYYSIKKKYSKNEDTELDVNQEDNIKIIFISEKHWVKVEHLKSSKCGIIPSECIGERLISEQMLYSSKTIYIKERGRREYLYYVTLTAGLVILLFGIAVAAVGVVVQKYDVMALFNGKTRDNGFNLREELFKLEKKFQKQPEGVWISLEACLTDTLNHGNPCIITLFNGGNNDLTDLLTDIGSVSLKLLNQTDNYIFHRGSKLLSSLFSFESSKLDLIKHRVMLISEMEKIPGDTIIQFHALCDAHTPAVKPAVIVFMFNYSGIKVKDCGNVNSFAINLINENWKNSVSHDFIVPIATRLTDYAAVVNSE